MGVGGRLLHALYSRYKLRSQHGEERVTQAIPLTLCIYYVISVLLRFCYRFHFFVTAPGDCESEGAHVL